MEPAAGGHDAAGRGLDVQDALASGHPLGGAVGDDATATGGVCMFDDAVHHVGHGLEAAVGMPGGPLRFARRVVHLADLVEVDERVEMGQVHSCERPLHREALALEPLGGGGDRSDLSLADLRTRRSEPRQFGGVFDGYSRQRGPP
jgi:hypothetical protein